LTRRVDVLRGEHAVLQLSDEPGPLVSTAPPPPNGRVATHPFLSGAARDPRWEGELKRLLDQSADFDGYVARLVAAGFTVREGDAPPGQ